MHIMHIMYYYALLSMEIQIDNALAFKELSKVYLVGENISWIFVNRNNQMFFVDIHKQKQS